MKILHIDSSVTAAKSVSRPLTKAAVDRLVAANPGATIVYRDLTVEPLRHYTAVLRNYGVDSPQLTDDHKHELATGKAILAEFQAADVIVVGAPMYNFGVPSQLKAWVDLLVVPGTTFRYGPNGPEGLLGEHRKMIVVSTRGGKYGPGSPYEPFDHQEKFLKDVFGFLGVKNFQVIRAEGVSNPEAAAKAIEEAHAEIAKL